jgi:ABC-type nitrate/sulfonate/bicarbonate transport system substrate-binding protein
LKALRFGVLSMVGILVVAGCATAAETSGSATTSAELRPVSVILDWSPNTNHSGLYLAQSAGYYAAEGLDVKLVEPGDTSGLQLIAAGQADFAVSVAESVVPARTEGLPVVSVAAIIEHNTSSLVSLASAGIRTPQDLQGHTYGGYEGALEKALISSLVSCDGGDPSTVTFTSLPGDDFRIGLTEKYYDTAWIFNGWDGIRLRELDHMDINTIDFSDYTDCIPDWYTPLIAASESMISTNPELVRKFLSATARGYAESMTSPEKAVDALLAAAPELDRQLVVRSADYLASRYADSPAAWGRQSADTWTTFVEFLIAHDLAPADFATAAAWNGSFLPAT